MIRHRKIAFGLSIAISLGGVLFANSNDPQPALFDKPVENAMFRGINLHIEYEGKEFPVMGFEDERFLIPYEGKLKRVSHENQLKLKSSPKFSTKYIHVEDLEVRPKASQEESYLTTIQALESRRSQWEAQLSYLMRAGSNAVFGSAPIQTQSSAGGIQEQINEAEDNILQIRDQIQDMEEQLLFSDDLVDSLYISFRVTPDTDMEEAYLFAVAQFTYPGLDSDKPVLNILTKSIGDLEAHKPKKVRLWMGNFPKDFNVVQMQYHFYTGREELPSSLTTELLPMNDDEAYEYLYGYYVTNYSGPDRKPQLFEPLDIAHFEGVLSSSQIDRTKVSFQLNALGEISDIQVDTGNPQTDQQIRELILTVRFLPAIKAGVPAPSQVNIPLRRIVR